MIRRREFITLLGGAAAAWPLAARAQQRLKVLRIGTVATLPRERPTLRAFEERLRELGYTEGENLAFDYTIERNFDRYDLATQDMLRRKVDIIITSNRDALKSAIAATDTLPIVMVALEFDPFRLGYVTSLARPVGNVTGVFAQQVELSVKRLQIFKDAFSDVKTATVFWDHRSIDQWQQTERAASSLGLQLVGVELRDLPYDYDQALERTPPDHRGVGDGIASVLWRSPETGRIRAPAADSICIRTWRSLAATSPASLSSPPILPANESKSSVSFCPAFAAWRSSATSTTPPRISRKRRLQHTNLVLMPTCLQSGARKISLPPLRL
jgi:ABC transporter substrate binding protein